MTTFKSLQSLRIILIGFLMWLSFNQAAHANLVTNPFLNGVIPYVAGNTTTATGWPSSNAGTGAAFNATTYAPPAAATTAATAAGLTATEFYSGCIGVDCVKFPLVQGVANTSSGAQQTISTVIGTAYTLSYWVDNSAASASGGTIDVAVYWGNTRVSAAAPAGWSLQTINLGVATSNSYTLTTMIRNDPNYSAITFLDVEPVVLSLTKANPASFAVGTPANYSLTINNNSTVTSGVSFQLLDQLPPNIQYNSVAFGAGLTGASCVASGAIATGFLLTCTISTATGIPPSSTGSLTINVTPLAATSGVAGINKASVQSNGGYPSVANSTLPPTAASPATCTANDTPSLGCAVAASITPSTLNLSKSNPSSFPVGTAANYTLTINNNLSVATATSFVLLDQLPVNIQFNSSAAGTGLTGAACVASGTVAAGQLLTCTITSAAGIPAAGTGSLTINVTPLAASAGVAGTNKASVPPGGTGSGVAPSTCTATGIPAGCAVAAAITPSVLSLTKTNPASLVVGTAANYALTISNGSGITSAASFTLLDQLPPNIQYNSVAFGSGLTGASCVSSGAIATGFLLTCTITSAAGIPAAGTGLLTINVTPQAASANVSGTNKASVPLSGTGSGAAPNTCTATGTPAGCAVAAAITPTFLSLTKTNPASFAVGVAANYSLTITNGGGIASGASFTLLDQLPPNIQYTSVAAGTGITSVTCAATGTLAAGQLVTCTVNITGGIPAAGIGTLTLSVTPQAAASGVLGINKASIPPSGIGSGGIPSACLGNNNPLGCAVAAAITPGASLTLAKSNPAIFAVNVAANYSLTIANGGSAASAASFTLLDQLPPNIQFNSSAAGTGLTGASCVSSGAIATGFLLTCTLTSAAGIPAAGTGSLTINVTPLTASAGVAGTNKASVPPGGTGSGVAPSTCTATGIPAGCVLATTITPTNVTLSVAKTATLICDPVNGTTNPKYIPGAVVRWTVTVTNSGTTSVNLSTVTDLLSFNTTADANLITGLIGGVGTPAACISATGTPEGSAGKGFKLAISGTPVTPATTLRPAASYPKFFTSVADADAAAFNAGTVTIDYALGFPVEGVAPNAYTAGELKPGEIATFYFGVTVN
jgi:large repetitive protein